MGDFTMPTFLSLTPVEFSIELLLAVSLMAAGYFGILYFRLKKKSKHTASADEIGDASKQSQNLPVIVADDSDDSILFQKNKERLEIAVCAIVSEKLYLKTGFSPKIASEHFRIPVGLFLEDFEKIRGEKFFDFINRMRMEHAAVLLSDHPQYTIEAIGRMCGIESRQHFHRLFSKYYGMTPAAWRSK